VEQLHPSSSASVAKPLAQSSGEAIAPGILRAAVLGEESQLSERAQRVFRATGTTHLLVVSGFQIGLVFYLLQRTLRAIFSRMRSVVERVSAEIASSLLALMGVSFYVIIIGAELSILRAVIMLVTQLACEMSERELRPGVGNLMGLIIVNAIWPLCLLEPSCQLTFAALYGLALSRKLLQRSKVAETPLELHSRLKLLLKQLTLEALAPWACTAPVVLFWFQTFSPVAPLVNLFAVPFFSYVCTAGGIVAISLQALGVPGAEGLLAIIHLSIEIFFAVLYEVYLATQETIFRSQEIRGVSLYALLLFMLAAVGLVSRWCGVFSISTLRPNTVGVAQGR